MSGRDERLAGRLPMWVWETLGETPPHAPGAEPVRRKLTEAQGGGYATTHSPALADSGHTVPWRRVRARTGRWEETALGLPVEKRPAFWTEKADAVDRIEKAGYLTSRYGTRITQGSAKDLRALAAEARRAHDISETDSQQAADASELGVGTDRQRAALSPAAPSATTPSSLGLLPHTNPLAVWPRLAPLIDRAFAIAGRQHSTQNQETVAPILWALIQGDDEAADFCNDRKERIDEDYLRGLMPSSWSGVKQAGMKHRTRVARRGDSGA